MHTGQSAVTRQGLGGQGDNRIVGTGRCQVESCGPLLWDRTPWEAVKAEARTLGFSSSFRSSGWAQRKEAVSRTKARGLERRLLHSPDQSFMGLGKELGTCHYDVTHMLWQTSDEPSLPSGSNPKMSLLCYFDKARALAVQTLSCNPEGVSSRVSVLPRLESWVLGCNPGLEIFEPPIWFLEKN